MLYEPMRGFTARLLVLLTLAGAFAPLLQALSGEQSHACCLRRLHASSKSKSSQPFLQKILQPDGNCCPPLTSPQSAQAVARQSVVALPDAAPVDNGNRVWLLFSFVPVGFSDRAPPRTA